MNATQNVATPTTKPIRDAPPQTIWSLIYVVVASITFAVLAFTAHTTPYFDFDLRIARAVQSIHAGWFDGLMRAVGWPGYPPQAYVWTALILVILFFYVSRWAAIAHVFAAVGIGAFGLLIKMLVDRPRPSPDLINVWNQQLDGGKFSFTAGHVEVYVAIFGFLFYLAYVSQNRSWMRAAVMIVAGLLVVLIGLARIYSGEHWFSDVVGGYVFGGIWLVLTIYFYNWGKSRFLVNERVEPIHESNTVR